MIDVGYFGFYPAKVINYDQEKRICMVSIEPFTRGSSAGIPAKIAYPVGHDDLDTEILIKPDMEVYVFFEAGMLSAPVVAFCRSHGTGTVKDIRRIRQKKIELIADEVEIQAGTVNITGDTNVGKTLTASTDVVGGGISVKEHTHGGVRGGGESTSKPN